jgi:hypothetical protein
MNLPQAYVVIVSSGREVGSIKTAPHWMLKLFKGTVAKDL